MPKKVIPFNIKSKGSKKSKDGKILEHGTIGKLKYEIYARGVIHITSGKLIFHKDKDIFEDEINEMDFDELVTKKEHRINGSGASDHLVFTYDDKNADIKIGLKKRDFGTIEKLKKILSGRK